MGQGERSYEKNEPASKSAPAKKAYRRPVLSTFGDVRRLTGGGGGTMNDFTGMMTRNCWIAEALYGVHSPRVALVRAWLARCYERGDGWALVVVPLYNRFGRRIAPAVRTSSIARRFLRPVFDRAVRRAYREYARSVLAHG